MLITSCPASPAPCPRSYGFVVYQDPAVTDIAIAGLNGLKMGERTLTVRRAEVGAHCTDCMACMACVPRLARAGPRGI